MEKLTQQLEGSINYQFHVNTHDKLGRLLTLIKLSKIRFEDRVDRLEAYITQRMPNNIVVRARKNMIYANRAHIRLKSYYRQLLAQLITTKII